jgi:hypothetical protein
MTCRRRGATRGSLPNKPIALHAVCLQDQQRTVISEDITVANSAIDTRKAPGTLNRADPTKRLVGMLKRDEAVAAGTGNSYFDLLAARHRPWRRAGRLIYDTFFGSVAGSGAESTGLPRNVSHSSGFGQKAV